MQVAMSSKAFIAQRPSMAFGQARAVSVEPCAALIRADGNPVAPIRLRSEPYRPPLLRM